MPKPFIIFILASLFVSGNMLVARGGDSLETLWIPLKPQILNYRITTGQVHGSFQTGISRNDSCIEVFTTLTSPAFSRTNTGFMTLQMTPLRSTGKTVIGDQSQMDNETRYESGRLVVKTVVKPDNRIVTMDTSFTGNVIDPSQIPLLVRVLQRKVGAKYEYTT